MLVFFNFVKNKTLIFFYEIKKTKKKAHFVKQNVSKD